MRKLTERGWGGDLGFRMGLEKMQIREQEEEGEVGEALCGGDGEN